ncbi:hypothetical protein BGZ94_009193 [Podila epigama]|nr:hypothetical protein BGZ94_009193 [Podila epigama]
MPGVIFRVSQDALLDMEDLLPRALRVWSNCIKGGGQESTGPNLPAWIIIAQRIQECIVKVTSKVTALMEQLEKRQLSSRSRKQFEVMKTQLPRLMGMLAGSLSLLENWTLLAASEQHLGQSQGQDQSQGQGYDIQIRKLLTTFVDKFSSCFPAKLQLMESAWEDLVNGEALLETRKRVAMGQDGLLSHKCQQ